MSNVLSMTGDGAGSPADPALAMFGGHAMQDQLEAVAPLVDSVWTQIAALSEGKAHVRVLFTSPDNQAGTTLLSAATAVSIARNMRADVMFVETHMRQPAAAGYLGTESSPGLSDLLLGHTDLETAVKPVPGVPGLHVLPAGTARPAIAGELAAKPAQELLRTLMTSARFVIFDAPPLVKYHEARGLLSYVDASVLVLQSASTDKKGTIQLAEMIEAARVPILGTVLNRHESDFGFLDGKLGING